MEKSKRVLVAMSGGVDSTAAALLCLQAGYECVGVTMLLHDDGTPEAETALRDAGEAARVAEALGFPHRTVNLSGRFEKLVKAPFAKAYGEGLTPNPCLACNRYIKFGALMEVADSLGCHYLATGHYARIQRVGDTYTLLRAACAQKDQSYLLYCLDQAALSRVLLPLGDMPSKEEVRRLVDASGVSCAPKGESQDICFIQDGDYVGYLNRRLHNLPPPGDFVTTAGQVLGCHRGIHCYTVGQRRGLGLALPAPLYVKDKRPEGNLVVLCPEEELYETSVTATDLLWCNTPPASPFEAQAQTRYHTQPLPCTVTLEGDTMKLTFCRPPRAPSPGQAVVLYLGDAVLGGGIITRS